jgi:hypothetical protein
MDVKSDEVFLNFLPTCNSELDVYSYNLTVYQKPHALQTYEFTVQASEFCILPPCLIVQNYQHLGLTLCLTSRCTSTLNVLAPGTSETFRWYPFIKLHCVSQWTTIAIHSAPIYDEFRNYEQGTRFLSS